MDLGIEYIVRFVYINDLKRSNIAQSEGKNTKWRLNYGNWTKSSWRRNKAK